MNEDVPDWWTPAALTGIWDLVNRYRIEFTRLDNQRMGARIRPNGRYYTGANHVEAAVRAVVSYHLGFYIQIINLGEEPFRNLTAEGFEPMKQEKSDA